ncbi:aminoglycoside phosphotransferase family protein [Kribbella antibiotica]|uniref:Aminoglycoside phosphotransferase family protein n=1 Tax=Kribbella antibiotica TaxID=190195 RepID=A0A4R4YRF7_9ACTN|nr:phosphotransferase [Kribbella antibiotica]TDD46759.1 aminoglycoside phosphotransferase family protein [Kribbella antibiotica]
MEAEEILTGGNVAAEVVRVGATVRKPALPQTAGVEALLEHLAGSEFAPRTLGRDERGRHVLEYIPGAIAETLTPFSLEDLHRVGRLIRELHDAMEGFAAPTDAAWQVVVPDPAGGDLICHNDLAPWNLVCNEDRWVFIDWDNAGPATRLWDLGYAATGFVPFTPDGDVRVDGPRLRALVDGYGLDEAQREALPAQIAAHTRGSYDLLVDGHRTGTQPWARLYTEGHGDYWGPTAAYIEANHDAWLTALL